MKRFLVFCLAASMFVPVSLVAQTRGGFGPFDKKTVEGQPIDVRTPEKADDKPLFAGQTRAPYHKTQAIKITAIASGLDNPWAVALLPDGKFLITEKPGAMRIAGKDGVLSAPLTGVPAVYYSGQVGLLDVVLDTGFASNHRIFFFYATAPSEADMAMVVASATLDEAGGALRDVKPIYQTAAFPKQGHTNNAGGRIAQSPRDGSLFVIIGDRSGSPPWLVAQQLNNALGKLIHITVEGKPVPGGPFAATPGALPEIYSFGHRSEQGLAFDPNGRLWEVEDGPRGGDELNTPEAGKNYGWPVIVHGIDYPGNVIGEAITAKAGMEQPRYYWDPVMAPSGLAFYKGDLFPEWKNSVLIGALRGQMLDRLTLAGDKVVNEEPLLTDLNARIRDVRVGADGAVYVLTDGAGGKLLKLTPQ